MPEFSAPDGARLFYTDDGDPNGLPVLALSGLSRNSTDFDYLAPHLPDDVRLIRLDYRGRGKSEWTGPETYTIPVETGDALALLDHLGLDKAAVLGTSRGGLIAMVLAATAKARLRGVCLVDIGPKIEDEGLTIIRHYIGINPMQKTHAEAARLRAEFIEGFDGVPLSRWQEEVERHFIETPDGLTINYDPKLRDAFQAASEEAAPDLWPMFDAFSGLPLALVRGANSELLSVETADEMSRRRPDMIRKDIANRAHVPFLDEPEALDVITRWLDALR